MFTLGMFSLFKGNAGVISLSVNGSPLVKRCENTATENKTPSNYPERIINSKGHCTRSTTFSQVKK